MPGMGTRSLEDILPATALSTTGFDDYGYLVKISESGATVDKTAAVTDVWCGVVVDSTVDPTTGSTLLGKPVGLQIAGIVPIKAIAGTYRRFDVIYTAQTAEADGHVKNDSSNSAVRVGVYVGEDNLVVSTGDKIEVKLAVS